jgi:acetyl-CoA carboxylase biotin carboxyl carrier protein
VADREPRPDARDAARAAGPRTAAARRADHAAIDRLADELLPVLVARLGATGLGELEVREGDWRVRLRRPAGERRVPTGGRAVGRGGGRPHDDGRATGSGPAGTAAAGGPSEGPSHGGPAGPGPGARAGDPPLPAMTSVVMPGPTDVADGPLIATSPAVGVFRPSKDVRTGAKVRAGDRIGAVDMLGVAQEVVAPVDGVVAELLAEDGDGVEYGQPLVAVEPLVAASAAPAPAAAGGEA